jgi:uncharacterized membrane protein
MKSKTSVVIWTISMALFFIFLYFFNITLNYNKPGDIQKGIVYEKAKVLKVISEELAPDPDVPSIKIGKQQLELEILTGKYKGKIVSAKNFVGRIDNKPGKVGTRFIISSFDQFITTTVVNYSRETALYALLLIFLFVIILFGKMKGVKSIFSLAFTLICVVYLFIPMIIRGIDPILASIIIVILSTSVTLLSLNGWCKKTITAGVSCIVCTMLAGVMAYFVGAITNISTFTAAEAQDLLFVSAKTSLRVHNLLFAGILIASLGAIMDTTMSIASSISEMKMLNPELKEGQLLTSGMNVGKDIMGTMTNTLILAFTGSSLNVLIVLFMYNMPYIQFINLDLLVIEIIQGLSGSIAVILSIPITAFVAAKILSRETTEKF